MTTIFTPIEIKHIHFANRIVLPPMANDKGDDSGYVTEGILAVYTRLADAGMGLLILEHHFIDPEGKVSAKQLSLADDGALLGQKKLTTLLRGRGIPSAVQISHSGANRLTPYTEAVSASAVLHPTSGLTARELSRAEIQTLIEQFGQAARRAAAAGYDAVEIHSAHGYLLSQFLSPVTNQRRDAYGGDLKNRSRFLLEVVEEIKGQLPETVLLLVRLGLSDNPPGLTLFPEGLPIAEGLQVCRSLESARIDLLDISAGLCGSRPKDVSGEAYFLPFARAVRETVRLPLIITGGVTRPETAEMILREGYADFIGVGRALAADLDWIRKARARQ